MTDLKAMEALTHPERFAIDKQMEAVKIAVFALKERIERSNTQQSALDTRWISVEDELPDMCGYKVLVSAENTFGQTNVFTAFTGYMEHGTLDFHSCEPEYDLTVWTITHWMPLPELPKEDK